MPAGDSQSRASLALWDIASRTAPRRAVDHRGGGHADRRPRKAPGHRRGPACQFRTHAGALPRGRGDHARTHAAAETEAEKGLAAAQKGVIGIWMALLPGISVCGVNKSTSPI